LPKPTTAPARLDLLLPWLNGAFDEHHFEGRNPEPVAVRTDYLAIRRVLADFLATFDGSADAGHIEVVNDPEPAGVDAFAPPTDDDLDDLEARLHILVEQGFDGPGGGATVKFKGGEFTALPAPLFLSATSLRFAVRNAGRQKPAKRGRIDAGGGRRIVVGGVTALRNYRAAGAYVLQVMGPMLELVPFLVAHLLTAANMAGVKRCERQGCAHLVITATAKRGRPQQFCSAACREWNRELEQQRKTRSRR
jgi:hypothetical protein